MFMSSMCTLYYYTNQYTGIKKYYGGQSGCKQFIVAGYMFSTHSEDLIYKAYNELINFQLDVLVEVIDILLMEEILNKENILSFTGFNLSQVVQDVFHPQYHYCV